MPFVEKKLDEFNRRRNFSPQRTLTRPPRLSESDGGQGAQRKDSPRRDTDLHREDFSWNHENTKGTKLTKSGSLKGPWGTMRERIS